MDEYIISYFRFPKASQELRACQSVQTLMNVVNCIHYLEEKAFFVCGVPGRFGIAQQQCRGGDYFPV